MFAIVNLNNIGGVKKIKAIVALALAAPLLLCAARLNPESHYQKIAAKKYGAESEVTMPDGTRCDLITETHAIEVDFADKRAGIILILESESDARHFIRVNSIVRYYELPIDVLSIRAWE